MDIPVTTPTPAPQNRYEIDLRDRVLLLLALGLGALFADLVLSLQYQFPALGVTLLVFAWEGVMFWYARGPKGILAVLNVRVNLLLTLAVLLLAANFALFSNRWFWVCNLCFLPSLMTVQMFQLFGTPTYPCGHPLMLVERPMLLLEGLCCRLGAPLRAISPGDGPRSKRLVYVLLGLLIVLPILVVVGPLLTSADTIFAQIAANIIRFIYDQLGTIIGRLLLGLLLAPFLFGLLYALRRVKKSALGDLSADLTRLRVDGAFSVTILVVLDLLYLFFVGVQSRALFGGAAYVEAASVSYASYARSGFFELVWVSAINLLVVLGAVRFCKQEGKLWQAVRLLSTLMVALSGVMLVSAAGRMTLYVASCGLSFKRFLTYWGMVMLSLFFVAALLKIWKKQFSFFQVLFTLGVAGWLLLNAVNVDAIVAHYNVSLYLSGNTAVMDFPYLTSLSYDALPALARLDGSVSACHAPQWGDQTAYTLDDLIADRRTAAAEEASSWSTWSLSAQLAAGG